MSLGHFSSIMINPEQIDVSPIAKVGELVEYLHPTLGYQVYRYVHNNSGGDIPAYTLLDLDDGSSVDAGPSAADTPRVKLAGVPQAALTDDYYGWALVYGDGYVLPDNGGIAQGGILVPKAAAATGRVDDAALAGIEHCVMGEALAAGAAGVATLARIRIL